MPRNLPFATKMSIEFVSFKTALLNSLIESKSERSTPMHDTEDPVCFSISRAHSSPADVDRQPRITCLACKERKRSALLLLFLYCFLVYISKMRWRRWARPNSISLNASLSLSLSFPSLPTASKPDLTTTNTCKQVFGVKVLCSSAHLLWRLLCSTPAQFLCRCRDLLL